MSKTYKASSLSSGIAPSLTQKAPCPRCSLNEEHPIVTSFEGFPTTKCQVKCVRCGNTFNTDYTLATNINS